MFNMSSYSEWQKGVVNRNYHVFNKLLKHPQVERIIAVDFLPFTFKRAIRNYWENIIKGPEGKVIYRDLTTRCVKIPETGSTDLFVFSTIDSIFSHQRVIKKLNKVLKIINNQSTINNPRLRRQEQSTIRSVWSYFPMFVAYFKGIKADLSIFDAVDNWIEHPSFFKYKEQLKDNYRIIAEKSSLIFVVAETLIDFFKDLGRDRDLAWVCNGIDMIHFTDPDVAKISDFKKIPRPIIGYLGIIQQRIDLDLLEYLAQRNPDKSFVLIGPLWPVFLRKLRRPAIEIKRLKKYKNIYLLGRKPHCLAPAYVKNFDLAISPHKLDKFIKSTNSLKVLEYLACGKPVVTTPASGVERFSHLVYIAQDYQDFNKKINQALENNIPELKQERIAQMKQQDWDLRIEEMMRLIKIKSTKLL